MGEVAIDVDNQAVGRFLPVPTMLFITKEESCPKEYAIINTLKKMS